MKTNNLGDKEKQKILEEVFNQMDIYGMILDDKNTVIMTNKKVDDDFGNIIGKKCYEVHHNTSSPPDFCAMKLIKNGTTGEEIFFDDAVTNRWYGVKVSKVLFGDKTLYVHLMTDISEKHLQEQRILELNQTLRILNKILRHDLLNYISVVSMSTELIKTQDIKIKQKSLEALDKSVELINKMRELESAISSGGELKIYDVRDILDNVVMNFVGINFNILGSSKVLADEALFSIFTNLINNAVIHGKTKRIDILIENKETFCIIKIVDYGEGIPHEFKANVFDEGFSNRDKGLGLGLFIVKKTIERYGGEVSLEDTVPQGTTIILKLKRP